MASPAWPPKSGVTTQHVPRNQAILTIAASTRIQASASQVFDTVLNVGDYGKWNQFCPKVTIQQQPDGNSNSTKLQLGSKFTFHVIMDSNKPQSQNTTQLEVCDISTPTAHSSYVPAEVLENDGSYTADLNTVYRIGWKDQGGLLSKGLRPERFHEVIILNENECEVRTWENQAGVLVYAVKYLYQKTLEDKFQMWCDDLKKYCEGGAKADASAAE